MATTSMEFPLATSHMTITPNMEENDEDSINIPFVVPLENLILPLSPNFRFVFNQPPVGAEGPVRLCFMDGAASEEIQEETDRNTTENVEVENTLEDNDDDGTERPWMKLPELVITEILSYLYDGDRFNASLVCKKWSELFRSPCLWRKRSFRFAGRGAEKSVGFAKYMGRYLEHLTVAACHPTLYGCKRFQKTVADFLTELTKSRARLRSFHVTQLYVERYWRASSTRDKLVSSLSKFLRCQRSLREVDVGEAYMPLVPGLRFIEGMATGSGRTIHKLNLEDYFHPRQNIISQGRYLAAINKMVSLKSLHLNYNCISDEVLEILTRNCTNSLSCLYMKVYKHDPHYHRIEGWRWKNLHRACPRLQVQMYFEGIAEYDTIRKIAIPETKLKQFHIWTGVHLGPEEMGLNNLLIHIGNSFHDSIEDVSLNLENTRDVVDEGVLHLLEKCKLLESFDIQAVLMVQTAEEVCKMQVDYKIGLVKCHIGLESLTLPEMEELERVVETYEDVMDERGVDFRLVANEDYPFV